MSNAQSNLERRLLEDCERDRITVSSDPTANALARTLCPVAATALTFTLPATIFMLRRVHEPMVLQALMISAALSLSVLALIVLFKMARPTKDRATTT